MTLPIGLQLYSVRVELAQNFEKTLEAVAQAGYAGVELAGLYTRTPEQVAHLLSDLNLSIAAMHCDVLTADGLRRSLDEAAALDCSTLVCPWRLPATYESEGSIQTFADQLNEIGRTIQAQGRKLMYHNHDFELRQLNGRYGLDILVEHLDPGIQLELDVYWVAVDGADPVALLRHFDKRVGLIHVKDGAITPSRPMTAVGEGKMDYTAIIVALPSSVPWLIVELDDCATDMMEAVQKSVQFMISKGLGHGRQN